MSKGLLITRATLFLQTKGLLEEFTAPAKLNHVIAAFEKLSGRLYDVKSKDGKWALVSSLCKEYGVIMARRRPKEYKAVEYHPNRLVSLDYKKPEKTKVEVNSDEFLASYEWRRVRMQVIKKFGARCQCCGATPADGLRMHVDHIKPRKIYPELALDQNNLQVLCEECNHGKGNWDMTDWRQHMESIKLE